MSQLDNEAKEQFLIQSIVNWYCAINVGEKGSSDLKEGLRGNGVVQLLHDPTKRVKSYPEMSFSLILLAGGNSTSLIRSAQIII